MCGDFVTLSDCVVFEKSKICLSSLLEPPCGVKHVDWLHSNMEETDSFKTMIFTAQDGIFFLSKYAN